MKKIEHFKKFGIEFKGFIVKECYEFYHVQITEWIGKGYPHLKYYIKKSEYESFVHER